MRFRGRRRQLLAQRTHCCCYGGVLLCLILRSASASFQSIPSRFSITQRPTSPLKSIRRYYCSGQTSGNDDSVSFRDASSLQSSRRQALSGILTISTLISISPSQCEAAQERTRPYAPLEALVPAARNRLLLNKCLNLADKLVQQQKQDGDISSLVGHLKRIIPPPPPEKSMNHSKQLTGTSMRVGMNIYTANLRFADSYVLTASNEDRRSYVRKYNQLPNVKQVVAADLDLRDLYRNLVETKMDDAQAELYQTDDHMNVEEFQSLLQEVNDAYRQWFALISESDVRAAEKEAMTSPTTESW